MCSQLLNVMSHGNFASKTIVKEIVLTNRAQWSHETFRLIMPKTKWQNVATSLNFNESASICGT